MTLRPVPILSGPIREGDNGRISEKYLREGFEVWCAQANRLLLRDYAIDFDQAGLFGEDVLRFYNYKQPPDEIIDWFAEKYDLAHVEHGYGRFRWPLGT